MPKKLSHQTTEHIERPLSERPLKFMPDTKLKYFTDYIHKTQRDFFVLIPTHILHALDELQIIAIREMRERVTVERKEKAAPSYGGPKHKYPLAAKGYKAKHEATRFKSDTYDPRFDDV